MDSTTEEIAVRPQEPARGWVGIRKRVIGKDPALVCIDFRGKLRTGRNALAVEGKLTRLPFDDNVIAKIHAARPALAADKCHGSSGYRWFLKK